jgi:hypothetical protein
MKHHLFLFLTRRVAVLIVVKRRGCGTRVVDCLYRFPATCSEIRTGGISGVEKKLE